MSRFLKLKRFMAAAICFLFMGLLCGCDAFITDTEKLLTPPALTGEMQPINEALKKSVKGEYTPVYPNSGEYRSAIDLYDIDGDGINEAFAFYSVTDNEITEMHINYIKKIGDSWRSVADNKYEAGGIEKIEFCDLNGDGIKEIVVGWEIYGSGEKKLGVYSAEGKKLQERLMEKYTSFICRDLDGDRKNELFLQVLFSSEVSNLASIYTFDKNGVNKTAGCIMDGKVKSVLPPVVSRLSNGKTALYIDEIKGAGSVTEVLIFENGELKNPLLDGNKGENTVTQRTIELYCFDINGDGQLEIPTSTELPSASGSGEKAYYTNWCGYDGETLTVKTVTVHNQADGYYITVPSKFFERLAISRNTELHSRSFYEYDRETASVGGRLFTVYAVDTAKADEFSKQNKSYKKIAANEQTAFFADINNGEKLSLSELKEMFRVIE